MRNDFFQIYIVVVFLFSSGLCSINAQVTLEDEIKISDFGLYFNGERVSNSPINTGENEPYDFRFGRIITPHGDCIKTYNEYVFMTWYRGGKDDRHMMLTRFNTQTGTLKTIEFPHRHTGYLNDWRIGESHNTIAVAISPLDGTIHLLYDMHAYSRTRPSDGSLSYDYFRYSYSVKNSASVPDEEFNLDLFVTNSEGGYKHLGLNGIENYSEYSALTYPEFFQNDFGELFVYMRQGGNNNGAYRFSKYTASTSSWSNFTQFNVLNASNRGVDYNWGLYGSIKYVNGKIRVGFQKRSANNEDKYLYQNGIYYAYSDYQDGMNGWKNHEGIGFSLPLIDAEKVKVFEPGDLVSTTAQNQVYIVSNFDWTVTNQGDVHFISQVRDTENNVTKNAHTFKKAGTSEFITSTNFSGANSIYTYGGNVYVIGLTNGRVFVDRAPGGSNSFARVYQANEGKVFSHGQVHIADGKLYYYLMENKSGSAQPIYLQTIDLDIQQDPFTVSLISPLENQKFNVGTSIPLSANASIENGSISKVNFLIDDVFYAEDFSYPYSVSWTPTTAGNYTVKAIAYNDNDEFVSSKEITTTVNSLDNIDLSGQIYRLKNIETGRYLDSENTEVIASISGEGVDKEWQFVKSGDYYNIDSQTSKGILRAVASNTQIVNTNFSAPNSASDKLWSFEYLEDGVYRFRSRYNSYLYNDFDNTIIHSPNNSDDRSKWKLELASSTLSVVNADLDSKSIKLYPNPAENHFVVDLNGFKKAKVSVFDVLGKKIYEASTTSGRIEIKNNGNFNSGLYFIKVIGENQSVYNTKLIIR